MTKEWYDNQVKLCREGRSAPFYENMPDNAVKVLLILLSEFTRLNPVSGFDFESQFVSMQELFEKGFLSITKLSNGDFILKPVIPDENHALGFPEFEPVSKH